MRDLLYQYNPWWEESVSWEKMIPREKYLSRLNKYLRQKQIVILTGLRRVGKTTLMKLIIKELLATNIDKEHIFYVSLDDYLLRIKLLMIFYRNIVKHTN